MKLTSAIELYVSDMKSDGRLGSDSSERAYRDTLQWHAADVQNRDPRYTNRDDVKATLGRWANPNTRANRRSIMVSFYGWLLEEGMRKDNPAEQTRRPKRTKTSVYRLTVAEARLLLAAAKTRREQRVIVIGVCAGLRSQELRGLQGRHFARPGWVWVSSDIAKGGRERWVPVLPDMELVVADIIRTVAPDEYVIPGQVTRNFDKRLGHRDVPSEPCSSQALQRLVNKVGKQADIAAHVHPHLLRHAYGDHIARYAGMRNAQFLLGHADVGTTETYTGAPTLDELRVSVEGFTFALPDTNTGSRGPLPTPQSQQYRQGDSNPCPWPTSTALGNLLVEVRSRLEPYVTRGAW